MFNYLALLSAISIGLFLLYLVFGIRLIKRFYHVNIPKLLKLFLLLYFFASLGFLLYIILLLLFLGVNS